MTNPLSRYSYHLHTLCVLITMCMLNHAKTHAQEPRISVTFSAMSWSGNITELYTFANSKYETIKLNGFTKTSGLTYNGPAPFSLFIKNVDDKGVTTFKAVIQLPQVAAMKSPFILVQKDGKNYQAFPYDQDPQGFNKGDYRFVNFTDDKLGIKLGDDVQMIQPQKDVAITPKSSKFNDTLSVVLAADTATGWRQVYSIGWEFSPEKRTLVFIYKNKRNQYRMRRIDEVVL